ncbi:ATPase family associated with various cellular activities (AAA) [Dokdonia sp. MED134]|uniref:AAA family ATPase n=1 Tax=Dokdonia sp. MED134 TaxID=313590 RepID=UPI000068AA1E|nr:EVE domain-containing protein [Dokdonia sp. MED134]EAQ40498.1 ATPase family associated with various cellular activities (AAA) [Dokdonia sp. MED134]
MHFHQKIHAYLLKYREKVDSSFNFIVRQRASIKDKNYKGGKFAQGLVFQGTNDYCFVALVDRSGGANATKSVGLVFKPTTNAFTSHLTIVFPGEEDEKLIKFYKTLASKFEDVKWDQKKTRAQVDIGIFEEGKPELIYNWLRENYPIIKQVADESGIPNLIIDNQRFQELQENSKKKQQEAIENARILEKEPNYWIFQGNPKIYNITNALKAGHLKSWKVAAHKDKIKPGDKVIIWQTGDQAGCYALAEVTSEVGKLEEAPFEMRHYFTPQEGNETVDRVQLEITHYNADIPLLSKDLEHVDEVKNLKAGNQGTNFTATQEEYTYFENFINDQEEFVKAAKKYNDKDLVAYFTIRDRITAHFNIQYNDTRIVNNVRDKRLSLTIGQRYCWTLFYKSSRGKFGIITTKSINDNTTQYSGGNPLPYYTRFSDISLAFENLDDCIQAIDLELQRTTKSSFDKYNNLSFEKSILDLDYRKRLFPQIDFSNTAFAKAKKTMVAPLNQLFYGPPGTGKTYRTISEAASIIQGQAIDNYATAKAIFQENLGERIEFITFHQNYSYEDFIQGLRPDVTNQALSFERTDGIFKKIATKALFEFYRVYKERELQSSLEEPQILPFSDVYKAFLKTLKSGQSFETITGNTVILDAISNNNLRFKHFEGGQSYVVSEKRLTKLYQAYDDIDKIININNDIRNAIGGSNSTVYYVALREIIAFKKTLESNQDIHISNEDKIAELKYEEFDYEQQKEALKDIDLNLLKSVSSQDVPSYVIIIDEINRANISRVFGELITLIEPDKRSHGDVPLTCTLPSGERFIVPSNLHIIGTMNTADKSIALLDIALRRRFEFIPMYPDSTISGVQRADILNKINEQITHLKTRDFTVGHSYFMGDNFQLSSTINNKVIPLLLEYFMNDEEEVKSILKEAGLEVGGWPLKLLNEVADA